MRREYLALLVMGAVLVAAWAGWRVLFGGDRVDTVAIVEVVGAVEHRSPDGNVPAAVGQAVQARDQLVAGPGGRAVLTFGADTRLTLDASSAIEVVSVDADGVRVELDEGRVSATVRPGSGRVAVGADGREVSAADADFTVARAADGTLAVVTERGEVTTNVPGVETLGVGRKLVAPRDRQALVSPASDALLLSVDWPSAARTRADSITVQGTTEPGARVILDGAEGPVVVQSDPDGRFVATVALREGANALRVHAVSALGQVADVSWALVRDTQAPPIRVELTP
jgi:hypothetical protein